MKEIDSRYIFDWEKYILKDGILYRSCKEEDEILHQVVLAESLWNIIIRSDYDDLGHQDRTSTGARL